MKLVLSSDNKGKLKEFRQLLAPYNVDLLSKAEAGFTDEIEETGTTFAENAFIKAKTVCDATGLPALADDSGLCVDALDGAPGLFSARFTGNHGDSDADRYNYLLKKLDGVENRSARFVCSICCVFPDGRKIAVEQTLEGEILYSPVGNNGFGYDPVFRPEGKNCSNAELSSEEKNAISHRGKAMREFIKEFEKNVER